MSADSYCRRLLTDVEMNEPRPLAVAVQDLRRQLDEAIARAETGERKRRTHEEKTEDAKLRRSDPDVPERVTPADSKIGK